MKRVSTVLICLVAAILLFLALEQRFFPPPSKGEIVQTWETTNTPFLIRVNMHIEKGGFAPVLGGAYYDFQSAVNGSDSWREIMTFRYDDPIDIPKEPARFANDQIATVFIGWMYGVTTDGGANWRVSEISDFLPKGESCGYSCIEDLRIDANGAGEARLNVIASSKNELKILETKDFGKTWRAK